MRIQPQTNRPFRLIAAALLLTAASCPSIRAASTLIFKATAVDGREGKTPAGRIYCGPHSVMTLAGRGWQSVSDAQEVARRLNALAEEGIRPEEIAVRQRRTSRVITARGRRVVEVHRRMAKYHHTDARRLARTWAENLKSQFGRPYLSVPSVVVPVGESRTRPVRGNIVGTLTARAQTPVVTVSCDSAEKLLRVFGLTTGHTELVVCDDHSVLRLPVWSAKYAARVVRSLTGSVTGDPAPPELVARAARAAAEAGLELEPGAWASVRPAADVTTPLRAGDSVSVPLRVSAAGHDYLSYGARPVVVVRNDAPPRDPIDVLMVSNSPERLLSHGLWFEGTLQDFQSARLLFHHVNSSDTTGDLVVEVWNLGDQLARVHVVEGLGGPTRDESWAGHKAASEFLANRSRGLGWTVPIPPRTAAPILSRPITCGATASGILELRALAAADLRVRLYLSPRRSSRTPRPIQQYISSPFLGRWQYPNPRREVSASYVVDRTWAFVTIGGQAAQHRAHQSHRRRSPHRHHAGGRRGAGSRIPPHRRRAGRGGRSEAGARSRGSALPAGTWREPPHPNPNTPPGRIQLSRPPHRKADLTIMESAVALR